ncbi:hypothetical protein Y032_0022g543 [Ancylostoma ceylanicum]|uniref:Uncharacterized protein n=1 Tax=Ancylostoma ceylanicum TaxID=53326 RepID=A0A016UYK5_9BILA|nr:hypothetical protein Y032_0022g543 [Ancylostoma ceylanicum]
MLRKLLAQLPRRWSSGRVKQFWRYDGVYRRAAPGEGVHGILWRYAHTLKTSKCSEISNKKKSVSAAFKIETSLMT